ncbi:MAG: YihY/virulence factor BrkB family protein [Nitrospirota bacterium]
MKFLRITGRSLLDFFKDEGLMLAGSMSYFSVMALVPFCLFLITLFGYFLGNYPELHEFFLRKLINFFPAVTYAIIDEMTKLVSYKGLGKYSLILYGVLSYQVFASLENSLNVIFKVKKKRNLVFSVLISLLVITLIIALLITSFATASFIPLLKTFQPFGLSLKIGKLTGFLIRFVLPFILVLFTITMMYILLPRTKIKFVNAFKGAFFATVFLEIAKHFFTWYVTTIAHFGKIYGSLTAFILFLLWIFYSCSIILIGAEVVHNLQNSRK